MFLALTLMDQEDLIRPFSLANTRLEIGFEFINELVRKGDRLIEAKILEGHTCTPLPIEAFDGYSCLFVLESMMAEWNQLLAAPLRKGVSNKPSRIDDINYHKICIARLELAIAFHEQKISHSQLETDDQLLTIARYRTALAVQHACLETIR